MPSEHIEPLNDSLDEPRCEACGAPAKWIAGTGKGRMYLCALSRPSPAWRRIDDAK